MIKPLGKKRGGDIFIPMIAVSLALFGILTVYSASNYSARNDYGDKFFYVKKQAIGVCIGFIAMIFTANFDYGKYKKLGLPAVISGAVLLAAVFIPGVGVESYGAKRWIGFAGVTIQPSEIAKFAFVIFTAGYFAKNPERVNKFSTLLPVLGVGAAFCLLIIIEPNMSITMCVGLLMIGMLFAAGVKPKHLAAILIPIALAVPVLIIAEPYRLKRLSAFLDPWASPKGEGYQLLQSLYALGSGGFFGVGLFNSRQKFEFLPFSESDFILSVIGEELGFVGVVLLFAVTGFLIYRGIRAALRAKDLFGCLIASGIVLVYAIQVVINALVVSGSIPPTGLPLPLISSGNTSVITFLAAFGVLYNVSKSGDAN
ncbi:MAG: putative lipid II flippase FtsW [Clostridia bacterium]|nr:putative lipid II flippase FtsW [Clostridia bacterium]